MCNEPLLSIIVPVYKTEKYITDCIDSILNQKFTNFELILVDDGSPDKCSEICDQYSLADERVKVIHKKNGGLSSARNAGIEIARGDYLTFVDSDDTISQDTYDLNMRILLTNPNIDMLQFPVYIYYGSSHAYIKKYKTEKIIGKDNIFVRWMQIEGYKYCYAWNKIYKKRLFQDIRFPEGKNFEDVYTFPLILELCNNIYLSEYGLYYYFYRLQSITQKANSDDYYNLFMSNLTIQQMAKQYYYLIPQELFIHYLYINNILIDYLRKTENKINPKLLINKIIHYSIPFSMYLRLKISLKVKIKNATLVFINSKLHYFCYVSLYKLLRK